MGEQLDLAKKRLFDRNALGVSNIKLFPGSNRDVTPEQVADAINKAITYIEAGNVDKIED